MKEKVTKSKDPLRKSNHRWNDKGWAFSMLSDVQEMVDMGLPKEQIIEQINQVKRVLMGRYHEIEGGMMIQVHEPKRKKLFHLRWGSDYSDAPSDTVKEDYFAAARGFDEEDIKKIKALAVGDEYKEATPSGNGLKVMRIR